MTENDLSEMSQVDRIYNLSQFYDYISRCNYILPSLKYILLLSFFPGKGKNYNFVRHGERFIIENRDGDALYHTAA